MNPTIATKNYIEPAVCRSEILRYAGCKDADSTTDQLLDFCLNEALPLLSYKVCYCTLPLSIADDMCTLGDIQVKSANLARNLNGCSSVLVFAATIGIELDRLIAKYGKLSPSRGLMFQAIGAERIEALCDVLCSEVAENNGFIPQPRFSPGYGDLPLTVQRDIFSLLDCTKRIGIYLNNSLLMTPSKSVTALMGLGNEKKKISKCSCCEKADCTFRGAI